MASSYDVDSVRQESVVLRLVLSLFAVIQRALQNTSHQRWRDASHRSLLLGLEVLGCQANEVHLRHNRFGWYSPQQHSMGVDCPCHLETRSKAVHEESCIQGNKTHLNVLFSHHLAAYKVI